MVKSKRCEPSAAAVLATTAIKQADRGLCLFAEQRAACEGGPSRITGEETAALLEIEPSFLDTARLHQLASGWSESKTAEHASPAIVLEERRDCLWLQNKLTLVARCDVAVGGVWFRVGRCCRRCHFSVDHGLSRKDGTTDVGLFACQKKGAKARLWLYEWRLGLVGSSAHGHAKGLH